MDRLSFASKRGWPQHHVTKYTKARAQSPDIGPPPTPLKTTPYTSGKEPQRLSKSLEEGVSGKTMMPQ
jgi:hypothetical protein